MPTVKDVRGAALFALLATLARQSADPPPHAMPNGDAGIGPPGVMPGADDGADFFCTGLLPGLT